MKQYRQELNIAEVAAKRLSYRSRTSHELAKYLYDHETITGEEFMEILNREEDRIEETQEAGRLPDNQLS